MNLFKLIISLSFFLFVVTFMGFNPAWFFSLKALISLLVFPVTFIFINNKKEFFRNFIIEIYNFYILGKNADYKSATKDYVKYVYKSAIILSIISISSIAHFFLHEEQNFSSELLLARFIFSLNFWIVVLVSSEFILKPIFASRDKNYLPEI